MEDSSFYRIVFFLLYLFVQIFLENYSSCTTVNSLKWSDIWCPLLNKLRNIKTNTSLLGVHPQRLSRREKVPLCRLWIDCCHGTHTYLLSSTPVSILYYHCHTQLSVVHVLRNYHITSLLVETIIFPSRSHKFFEMINLRLYIF